MGWTCIRTAIAKSWQCRWGFPFEKRRWIYKCGTRTEAGKWHWCWWKKEKTWREYATVAGRNQHNNIRGNARFWNEVYYSMQKKSFIVKSLFTLSYENVCILPFLFFLSLTFIPLFSRIFLSRYGSPHHCRSQSVKAPGRGSGRPNQLSLPQQRSRYWKFILLFLLHKIFTQKYVSSSMHTSFWPTSNIISVWWRFYFSYMNHIWIFILLNKNYVKKWILKLFVTKPLW